MKIMSIVYLHKYQNAMGHLNEFVLSVSKDHRLLWLQVMQCRVSVS